MKVQIQSGRPEGCIRVPPSKSIAHRALIAAALAHGESRICNFEMSEDLAATCRALTAMGAEIRVEQNTVSVRGVSGKIKAPQGPVDCGESGSTLRFLIPLFSLCEKTVSLTGHGRLLQRPLSVYETAFEQQGLSFRHDAQNVTLCGALKAGEYEVLGNISSQFITGLLFALCVLEQDSVLHIIPPFESRSYVMITLDVLHAFGVQAYFDGENTIRVKGGMQLEPRDYTVEGDYSQAAFFAVAGAVRGGITLKGLNPHSLQGDRVILENLMRCGAKIQIQEDSAAFFASELSGCSMSLADCPDLGPALMVLGTFCRGKTVLTHAGRLRIKESDRIETMCRELSKMGAEIECDADRIVITGSQLHGCDALSGCGDHRVVMALTAASVAAGVSVTIEDAQAVCKSWPHFFDAVRSCGCKVFEIQEKTD